MSGPGEQRPRRVEDEEVDAPEVVEVSGIGRSRMQMKTPRRCVQTKLNFFMSPKGIGRGRGGDNEEVGESSSSGDEGGRKPKTKKRKAQSRTPSEAPVTGKEAIGFNTRNKKLAPTFADGSDFFLKVSEKRLKQKHQKEQEDILDLTVEGDMCSEALHSVGKKSYLLSSDPKGPKFKEWLTSGKSSAAKDPGAYDLNNYQSTMNPASESRNTEEGNVHASATRTAHPFFSCWKTTKTVSECLLTAKLSKNYRYALDEEELIFSPPVHVFETLQDNAVSLDWGDWKFSERSSLDLSDSIAPQGTSISVPDVLTTPLKFDSIIPFVSPTGAVLPDEEMHLLQIPGAIDQFAGSEDTLAFLTYMQETHNQHVSHLKMFQGPKENVLSSRCTASLDNLENEQQRRLSQESLTLYQLHRDCWTECGLWTNKYQPDKAVEVCGNTESVRFLSEWLKSWQERQLQTTKNSSRNNGYLNDDSDDSMYQNDSDSENEDAVPLRNVLLVSGPVGCGKSAAIYACAKEQGFQVVEVNASDERNGTHIKQKFGEAMDSHAIELCSIDNAVDLKRKQDLPFTMGSSVNMVAREFKNGDVKEASRLCKAAGNDLPANAVENQSSTCRVANKNLFLFEDVDVVFDEDRGFITTIMQLAETSKRPIILTRSSKNPILPEALSKLVVDFTRPSTEELLMRMLMVCASEEAHASPQLLERLIRSCQGDIRKTFLLLQFWCQGQRGQQDGNIQCTYSPLLFDLDAAHCVITKIIPWAIPCELSLKVEEEIAKAMSASENQVILHQVKEEDDMIEPTDASNISKDETGASTAKEEPMAKSQCPSFPHVEFLSPSKDHGDFSDDSGSPLTFSRRSLKQWTDTVLSSQSEDVLAADTTMDIRSPTADSTLSPDALDMQSSQPMDHPNCLNPFDEPFGEYANLSRDPFMIAEIPSTSHVCDSYVSTYMPETSLVPETEISNREAYLSTTSSRFSVNFDKFLISNIGSMQALSQADINYVNGTILATHKDPSKEFANAHGVYTESVHGSEELGLSQKEAGVDSSRGYQLMDECSRAGFGMESVSVNSFKCHTTVGSVEDTWRKLCSCHEDLNSYITPLQKDAMKILNITSRLTDLISEADILLRSCLSLTSDFLEPSAIPFDEPCSSSWCDEHLEIASTFAQHGLCFHASKAATNKSKMGYEVPVYLAQEMLAASTSSMALGKLLSQKKTRSNNFCTERGLQVEPSKCGIPLGRELESMLCDAVQPILPARLFMVLKGQAFHEYVSFLSCMSKSENSRLSENGDQLCRRQRVRASRHYLRSLPFTLSPEDVALLAGYSCFGQEHFR